MKPKTEKFVYDRDNGSYVVTFDDGSVVNCKELRSKGTKREKDGHYDHVLKFSDGVTELFVGSQEEIIIPDISGLY
jgi:hypothetical protein